LSAIPPVSGNEPIGQPTHQHHRERPTHPPTTEVGGCIAKLTSKQPGDRAPSRTQHRKPRPEP
jgi:hypothetical protein